jgi:hypothetical protein
MVLGVEQVVFIEPRAAQHHVALVELLLGGKVHAHRQRSLGDGEHPAQIRLPHAAKWGRVVAHHDVAAAAKRLDGKIVDHATIHVPAAVDLGGCEDHGHRARGQDGRDEGTRFEDLEAGVDDVRRREEEPDLQRFEGVVREVLAEAGHHLGGVENPCLAHGDDGEPKRAGLAEELEHRLRRVPRSRQRADDGSRARSGDGVRLETMAPQRIDHADVGDASRATTRQDQSQRCLGAHIHDSRCAHRRNSTA